MSPKSNQNVDKSDMAELIAFWDDVSSSQSEETEDRLKKNDWVKSRLESLFPDMTGLNIADIGTGCGLLAISYAKLGHNVDATDVSEKMLEKAKVLADKNGVKVNFILDDAMDTKLPENHYDLVLLRDVLSNLVDAPRALLSIIDIVKPGGILLISDGRYFRYLYDREYKAREEFFELKDGNSEYASMLGLTPEQYLRLEKTVGHFDINASLNADITKAIGDSILITINQCSALDKGSGLMLKSLTANVLVSKGIANLSDVVIQLPNTQLQFANGTIQLPSKKLERPLEFSTSPISGRVILKDIARPFAPVLSKFNIPLSLRVNFSGNAEQLKFQNVSVGTEDKQLSISANGSITGLKDKHQLAVRFHVNKMIAKGGSKERIINQFPVKKFMMKQLHNLGTIHYTGDFSVLWKKETFQGLLNTVGGRINFNFSLDELNKYVYGTARTDSLMLGKVMDMPDIGKIACKANFKFDISKPRTAKMRQQKGGKLPIGQVDAEVYEAKYKKIKVRDIVANIQSDGAVAEGNITMKGGRVDLLCSFSFTNTNEMRKTKIKPGIRFHKLSEEKRAEKEEKKAAKRAEKEEKKAAKRVEKEEKKAAKQAEKAEKKAAKQAEKEERKRLKEEKRAAKKAAKAEAKAALLQ